MYIFNLLYQKKKDIIKSYIENRCKHVYVEVLPINNPKTSI